MFFLDRSLSKFWFLVTQVKISSFWVNFFYQNAGFRVKIGQNFVLLVKIGQNLVFKAKICPNFDFFGYSGQNLQFWVNFFYQNAGFRVKIGQNFVLLVKIGQNLVFKAKICPNFDFFGYSGQNLQFWVKKTGTNGNKLDKFWFFR